MSLPRDSSERRRDRARLTGEPRLLSVLPMIYVAWADGDLSKAEIGRIRERVRSFDWLDAPGRSVVESWLDPEAPPSAGELRELLVQIRRIAAGVPDERRQSLVGLGLEMARLVDDGVDGGGWATPEVCEALEGIEDALGVAAAEACRNLLTPDGERPETIPREAPPTFDVRAMAKLLDGHYRETCREVRELLRRPAFHRELDIDVPTRRERVFEQCRELARHGLGAAGYPPEYGGQGDLGRAITVFETLAFGDLSLLVKFGIQFGLFGGSVLMLGTRRHHEKYLADIGSLELAGCFAMTEIGHGSNVRDIETIARFDRGTDEFIVHTPSRSATKDWIGNAALHGRMATVFAQLEVEGTRHGVHAFLVPIRDENGRLLSGVGIEDCGLKLGLNGLDNGRITFDNVRIPRENLLDRFGQVTADGTYSSPIANPSRRFFAMLGALVGGRVSLAAAAVSAAKSGLTIAVRYGARRKQFGPAGEPEIPILDYRTHQRRLMPLLATTYALAFSSHYLLNRYLLRSEQDRREVEALAAGLKAYASWHCTRTLQTCREACGGRGYSAANRFADLKADTDVFTTFEGDNTVLMQLVARACLTEYGQQFDELELLGVVKHVARQAKRAIAELNPVVTRMTDEAHLRDPDFQLAAFRYREEHLLVTLARRLKKRIDDGMDSFLAFNDCQDHALALGNAHIERVVLEQFIDRLAHLDVRGRDDRAAVLKTLCDLFALWRIEEDRGWFLENGYIESGKAKAIRKQVNRLCGEAREQAVHLVQAFSIPDEVLGAPIAVSSG